MVNKTVNILGTEYEIKTCLWKEDKYMQDNSLQGYCAEYGKRIITVDPEDEEFFRPLRKDDIERSYKETLRHEIFHAFLNESGLSSSSGVPEEGWAKNEEMIDWFAIQSPKIFKIFQELDILSGNIEPDRKCGKCITIDDEYEDTLYKCMSECHEDFVTIDGMPAQNLYKYCPNCGAKMEEYRNE